MNVSYNGAVNAIRYRTLLIVSLAVSMFNLPAASTYTSLSLINKPAIGAADRTQPAPADQAADAEISWSMAGANPQRTSWTPEEVKGPLRPVWYKPIEPFIPSRFQIIAAQGNLYISTARGLYTFDAATGADKWVYATELPLGNSPTISNGVAYVGGLDHRLYALDAATGNKLWTFEAGAGFDTNPLVVNNTIYMGSRDGYFYAVSSAGQLAWKFLVGAPIHFSAAYADGVVYFAADDNCAYALNAATGRLKWQSAKFPGASGFHSWWPVIYGTTVDFSGSSGYRTLSSPGAATYQRELEFKCWFPSGAHPGTLIGARLSNRSIPTTRIRNCQEKYPYRRVSFLLTRTTGKEVTYDLDHDGRREYMPANWVGTYGGNRYPPIVSPNGILYQSMTYLQSDYSRRGQVTGWKLGASTITTPTGGTLANDEPAAYSGGGNVIYWSLCCDREAGGVDLSKPFLGKIDPAREWWYFQYNLAQMIPGYAVMYNSTDIDAAYGSPNGVYGEHGDQNPPIPYRGKLFMLKSNTLVAFAPNGASPVKLAPAVTRNVSENLAANQDWVSQQLAEQVTKILNAGHLRPGYGVSGTFDRVGIRECGSFLLDYWHDPSDIQYTLLAALPYLPDELKARTRTYLQSEFAAYPPTSISHIGWKTGAAREAFLLPADVTAVLKNSPAFDGSNNFAGWAHPPHTFYALWKYAAEFGGAKQIYAAAKNRLDPVPPDTLIQQFPYLQNAYIAGYMGFLELEKLAGYPETTPVRTQLNRLLVMRAATFSKDSYFGQQTTPSGSVVPASYCKTLNVSLNFMYLVPELGQYLHDHALSKVESAVNEYNRIAPYWFVARFEQTYAEGAVQPLYDVQALFQAKAQILKQNPDELAKYLDTPAFAVGDLFYIQNLVAILAAK